MRRGHDCSQHPRGFLTPAVPCCFICPEASPSRRCCRGTDCATVRRRARSMKGMPLMKRPGESRPCLLCAVALAATRSPPRQQSLRTTSHRMPIAPKPITAVAPHNVISKISANKRCNLLQENERPIEQRPWIKDRIGNQMSPGRPDASSISLIQPGPFFATGLRKKNSQRHCLVANNAWQRQMHSRRQHAG